VSIELQGRAADGTMPRALVPSLRQQESGQAIGAVGDAWTLPAVDEAPAQNEKRSRFGLRQYLSSYNLRGQVTGTQALVVAVFAFQDLVEKAATGTSLFIVGAQRDLHISSVALVAIIGALGTLSTLLSPLIGFYGDRVNRLRLVIPGAFILGIGTMLSGTGGLTRLILLQLIVNVGAGLAGPLSAVRYSLVADYFAPDLRGRIFAILNASGNVGLLLGPLTAGILADTLGWRTGFLIFGAVLTAAAFAYMLLREPSRGASDRVAAGLDAAAPAPPPAPTFGESLRAVWAVRTLRRIYFAFPVVAFSGAVLYGVNFVHLRNDFGFSTSALGVLGTIGTGMSVVFAIAMGPVVDRLTRTNPKANMTIIGATMLAGGIVFVGAAVAPTVWLALPLSMLMFSIGALSGPAQSTLPSLVAPPRVRAFGLSLIGVWGLPGSLLAGPLIIFLFNQYGMVGAMLMALPVFVAGAIMYWTGGAYIDHDMRAARAAAAAESDVDSSTAAGRRKVLVCRDVDVTYSGVQVLFGVDFDVEEGEIVALLGTNGAGKSTLLRAISGLTEASNGAIFFDGRDITHLPTPSIARAGVVMVLGGRAIFPNLTVQENLDAATWTTAEDAQFVRTQMHRVLDEFFPSLRSRLHERAGTLSGGEQQMLALGQAFLMKPRLLMIDELSLGLAPAVVAQLLSILRAIHEGGTTVILVEQSVNVALTVAERAVFMEKGEVRFVGPTAELLRRPDIMRSVFFSAAASSATSLSTTHSSRATQTTVLEVEDVACRFGGVQALRGVSLSVRAGEIVGIIGPNGAGKTTLFDAVSGFVPAVSGTVRIGGHDVTLLDADARARLGLSRSFQDARLFSALSVRETITLAMERHGAVRSATLAALWLPPVRQSESRLRRRADSLVEMLGLQRWADWPVGELSTGTRRIVDVACMMATEPEVLLLDEPSSGVAQAEVQQLAPVLLRLRAETGCAMLVIEHDMSLISTVSDRLVAMELGSVVVEGRPDEVLSDARVVASYLGTTQEAIARSGA
jgi:branched-chain amino acid transport system ATP-binding protein